MFALMVIVLFFFREFGRLVVTFCIGFDTSIIILLILITVFRGFSIPELQDRSKLFHLSLLTFLLLLFILGKECFQFILPLGQVQDQILKLGVLSLKVFD